MRTLLVCTLGLSLLAGGIAWAANWNTSGSGTAAAKAGTATAVTAPTLTISTSTSGTSLAPSLSAPLVVSITNPNTFPISVSAINVPTAAQPANVDATHLAAGCTLALAKVSIGTAVSGFTLPASIAAGATGTFTSTSSTAVTMAIDSDNNCQGAVFGFPATVTAAAG